MPLYNKIIVGTIVLLILVGSAFWYWQKFQSEISPVIHQDVAIPQSENIAPEKKADASGTNAQPTQTTNSRLENKLLDTAWIQLDQNGKETDFEIEFLKTKENDPLHQSYDYADYLHHRPGTSGYWKVEDNTIEIRVNLADLPYTIYNNLHFTENILQMTDDGTQYQLKFKRINPEQKDTTLGDIVTVDTRFLDFVKQKIRKEYIANGSTKPSNVCWQYINDEYLISYDNDNTEYGMTKLGQEKSFKVKNGTLSIIPTGYSSAIESPCAGTPIDFSFSELATYIKSGVLLERLR